MGLGFREESGWDLDWLCARSLSNDGGYGGNLEDACS